MVLRHLPRRAPADCLTWQAVGRRGGRASAGGARATELLSRRPLPMISAGLERWIGRQEVMKGQVALLLEIAEQRHVDMQIMPTRRESHAGLDGPMYLVETREQQHSEIQKGSVLISHRREKRKRGTRRGASEFAVRSPPPGLVLITMATDEKLSTNSRKPSVRWRRTARLAPVLVLLGIACLYWQGRADRHYGKILEAHCGKLPPRPVELYASPITGLLLSTAYVVLFWILFRTARRGGAQPTAATSGVIAAIFLAVAVLIIVVTSVMIADLGDPPVNGPVSCA